MKEEFKTEELRDTATEIKEAVRSKSVTAEMVGGTLLGLVNAVGEVVEVLGEIPREHVTVKVYGFDGTARTSTAGGTVIVDIYTATGFPAVGNKREELIIGEDETVEFDVPHGYGYAVYSKVAGLGASMQIVKTASHTNETVKLYNLPIGVFYLWLISIHHEVETEDAYSEYYPFVTTETLMDAINLGDKYEEDTWFWRKEYDDNYSDEQSIKGIIVSTAETTFVLEENNKSADGVEWCDGIYYGTGIPTLPYIGFNYFITGEDSNIAYNEAVYRATLDYNGNLNTAKIIAFSQLESAAKTAATLMGTSYYSQRFLPSAGQLALMQLNHRNINTLMEMANRDYDMNFILLPYQKENGGWSDYESWWSSTQVDGICSWVVSSDGRVNAYGRYFSLDVRAVSAFHF